MELAGKVIRKEIKDFGKGKGAEAREVEYVTVKLSGVKGERGLLVFAPGEDSDEYELSDPVHVVVEQRQVKLELKR
ncbi:MAG TPA: hypothetical protein VJY35_08925 [Candidatus Eisenbacteria bacterium]|nr:hypothetical protein [Candidatus Eisenbacteria bacterium]